MVFTLPDLGYAFYELEPAIDAQTMEIHHDKHHAGYVKKLNAALAETSDYNGMELEQILANLNPDHTGVRNNGGGHYNHSLYWKVMAPGGGSEPTGALLDAINSAFGTSDAFVEQFSASAKSRFGSGWAWLCVGADHKLFITSTPNQDNPLMTNVEGDHGTPILGIDVWEHAYYLHYQNRRADYIQAFMGIVNWNEVSQRFAGTM
ncbi:MAG: superoxide dismutase [Flavobacteriales bacterium]|nr:superoxide dismutase [Flavobacteriales bacterium]